MSAVEAVFSAESGCYDDFAVLRSGGEQSLADLFSKHRGRLERIVGLRLDPRLLGRVDPADVVQEAYIEVARRMDDFLAAPSVAFFVWLRQITWQTLLNVHRRHLGQKRNAGQDISLHGLHQDQSATSPLVQQLAGSLTSPSQAAMRNERMALLQQAIASMDRLDREILALRHFEQLSNIEVAQILGIKKTAASNRYVRALKRLRQYLDLSSTLGDP
jgi:RNA polymerase sigma-70 factor (ECF subfamily)